MGGDRMNKKAWWKSKTIWFNVLSAIAFVVGGLIAQDIFSDPLATKIFAVVLILVNLGLRFVTDTGVGK